jgi:hypothetical protein
MAAGVGASQRLSPALRDGPGNVILTSGGRKSPGQPNCARAHSIRAARLSPMMARETPSTGSPFVSAIVLRVNGRFEE